MLGGSSSAGSSTVHTSGHSYKMDAVSSTKLFPCNTCTLTFDNSQAQRTHMREPWHVYNLKRRMASLPPISEDAYANNVATSLVSVKQPPSSAVLRPSSGDEAAEESDGSDDVTGGQIQINCCLFCTKASDNLDSNIEHMSTEHGLYLPEIERLSSLETTVSYLRTVIVEYNECLYCGAIKQSAESIRRHMLDRGHCMINLEREPELLEFWEFSDSEAPNTDDEETPTSGPQMTDATMPKDLSQTQHTLPSGKTIGTKSNAEEARRFARRTARIAKEADGPSIDNANTTSSSNSAKALSKNQVQSSERTVAVRDAAGLVGVSSQQMRSLVTLQRKTQRQQAIVQASASWADELGGVGQKHYKQKMNLRAG